MRVASHHPISYTIEVRDCIASHTKGIPGGWHLFTGSDGLFSFFCSPFRLCWTTGTLAPQSSLSVIPCWSCHSAYVRTYAATHCIGVSSNQESHVTLSTVFNKATTQTEKTVKMAATHWLLNICRGSYNDGFSDWNKETLSLRQQNSTRRAWRAQCNQALVQLLTWLYCVDTKCVALLSWQLHCVSMAIYIVFKSTTVP